MLRATVAGVTMELYGCEQWLHTDKLASFASENTAASVRIFVEETDTLPAMCGEPIGHTGVACWHRLADGTFVLFRRDQRVQIAYNADFSEVHIRLTKGESDNAVHRYRYVLQMVGYRLLTQNGALLHSAGLDVHGNGIALCGRSGIGKSTVAAHCLAADKSIAVLCEDAPAVLHTQRGAVLCGTPFCGDDEGCCVGQVPLRALVFLAQGTGNRLTPLSSKEALHRLLQVMVRPYYQEDVAALAVQLALEWVETIPSYEYENDGTPLAGSALLEALAADGVLEEGA